MSGRGNENRFKKGLNFGGKKKKVDKNQQTQTGAPCFTLLVLSASHVFFDFQSFWNVAD
jgi:hypothetical protein